MLENTNYNDDKEKMIFTVCMVVIALWVSCFVFGFGLGVAGVIV